MGYGVIMLDGCGMLPTLQTTPLALLPNHLNRLPKSREIMMFVCLQQDTSAVTSQASFVFIVLIIDYSPFYPGGTSLGLSDSQFLVTPQHWLVAL